MRLHHRLTMPVLLLLVFISTAGVSLAQMRPAPGAVLHYRMAGFSFPKLKGATEYTLHVYEADHKVLLKPIITKAINENRVIATLPAFGRKYSWQVIYQSKGRQVGKSKMQYFSVAANPYADTSRARIVVVDSAAKYSDMLVFFDNTRTLYNMKGEPLWFVPFIKGMTDSTQGDLRDLKITDDGTITFMTTRNVYEMDYDGHILWKSITPDTTEKNIEQYHHEFTKLKDGRYITMKDRWLDSAHTHCASVVMYNRNHKIVWDWNACKYLQGSTTSMHLNAFYLDLEDSALYTSYRNSCMVIRSKYPEGNIVAKYGTEKQGKALFYYQHNCTINSDGNLMLFNNNFDINQPIEIRNNSIPTVAIFKEPVSAADTLEKVWEFATKIDTLVKPMSSAGGKVDELEHGDYLVCTGLPGRVFIVTKEKQVLWNVLTQKKDAEGWKPYPIYRTSPVRRHQLEQLIFGSPAK